MSARKQKKMHRMGTHKRTATGTKVVYAHVGGRRQLTVQSLPYKDCGGTVFRQGGTSDGFGYCTTCHSTVSLKSGEIV